MWLHLCIWIGLKIPEDCLSDKSSLEFFNDIFLVLCVDFFLQVKEEDESSGSDDFGKKNHLGIPNYILTSKILKCIGHTAH